MVHSAQSRPPLAQTTCGGSLSPWGPDLRPRDSGDSAPFPLLVCTLLWFGTTVVHHHRKSNTNTRTWALGMAQCTATHSGPPMAFVDWGHLWKGRGGVEKGVEVTIVGESSNLVHCSVVLPCVCMKTSTHVSCSVPALFSLPPVVPLESPSDTLTDGTTARWSSLGVLSPVSAGFRPAHPHKLLHN